MEISTVIHVVQKNEISFSVPYPEFNLTRLHISGLVGLKSWCSFLQGEERDTLWLHAWNVRPSKGISVDLTMFCGVKNTTPPSSKIMTTMRLCKKIKRKDRRRVNDCQSWEKEKGHSPFFYCKVGEDFLSGGAERFFDQQNWAGQVWSICTEFTFFLFRAYILKCAWTEANNWIIYNGVCFLWIEANSKVNFAVFRSSQMLEMAISITS